MTTREFWKDAAIRAALTAAQFFLVTITASGALSLDLNNLKVAALSAAGAAASVITSAIRLHLSRTDDDYPVGGTDL